MNVVEEKLKYIVDLELPDHFKLRYLAIDDFMEDDGMFIWYNIDITSNPTDYSSIINTLKDLEKELYKILSRYKFLNNGKMVKVKISNSISDIIHSITFKIDEIFVVEGSCRISWE